MKLKEKLAIENLGEEEVLPEIESDEFIELREKETHDEGLRFSKPKATD